LTQRAKINAPLKLEFADGRPARSAIQIHNDLISARDGAAFGRGPIIDAGSRNSWNCDSRLLRERPSRARQFCSQQKI